MPRLASVPRALLYTFSAMLVAWFARGHGWARVSLVTLMTGVGSASVLVSTGLGLVPVPSGRPGLIIPISGLPRRWWA